MTNPEIIIERKKYGSSAAMDYTMRVYQKLDEETIMIDGVKYQKVEKPEPQTLYEALHKVYYGTTYVHKDEICDAVERWMTQYECDYVVCAEYLQGYNALMETLKENLK